MYKARFAENRELTEASAATQVITHIEEAIEILEKQESEMSRKSVAHLREKLKELQDLFKSKQPAKAKKEPKESEESAEEEAEESEEHEEKETKAEEMKEGNEFQMNPMGGDEEEQEDQPNTKDDIFVFSAAERGLGDTLIAYRGIRDGKFVGESRKTEVRDLVNQIKDFQRKEGYFGNVWRVNNRGQVEDLFDPSFYESTKAPYKPKFQETREFNPMAPEKEGGETYYAVDLHNYRDAVHYLIPFESEEEAKEALAQLKNAKNQDNGADMEEAFGEVIENSVRSTGGVFDETPSPYNYRDRQKDDTVEFGDDTLHIVGSVSGYSF